MLRELFHIGPVTVYGYGLMIAIGVITCVLVAMRRAKTYGVDPDILFNAAFIGIVFGIIGAKLMYWITILPEIIENPRLLLDLTGGFVVYGGLVMGILAAVIYLKIRKETVFDKLDLAVASIALAQGFGRIGCFLAGCCYGKVAPDGAWYAVVFPNGAEAPAGIGLYPTQLMSSCFNFLLFFFLWFMTDRVRFRGAIVSLYMMIYSVARFFIEFIRTEPKTVGSLTTAQFTAIFIFAGGVILFVVMKMKGLAPLRKIKVKTAGEDAEKPEETEETAGEADGTEPDGTEAEEASLEAAETENAEAAKKEESKAAAAEEEETGAEEGSEPAEEASGNGEDTEASGNTEDTEASGNVENTEASEENGGNTENSENN